MLLNRPPIWGGLLSNNIHENASVIRKTHFKFYTQIPKDKGFCKNLKCVFLITEAFSWILLVSRPPQIGGLLWGNMAVGHF